MKYTEVETLSSRLQKHAAAEAAAPVLKLIDQIIALRCTLLEFRDQGHSASKIAEWLATEGLHINDGTLRNYLARIVRAEHQAREQGLSDPNDEDIAKICLMLEREKLTQSKNLTPQVEPTNPPHHAKATLATSIGSTQPTAHRSDNDL